MNTVVTLKMPIDPIGEGLKNFIGTSTFGLTNVKVSEGTVMYVPDPDNDANTIFWVRNVKGGVPAGENIPSGYSVTLELTYLPE